MKNNMIYIISRKGLVFKEYVTNKEDSLIINKVTGKLETTDVNLTENSLAFIDGVPMLLGLSQDDLDWQSLPSISSVGTIPIELISKMPVFLDGKPLEQHMLWASVLCRCLEIAGEFTKYQRAKKKMASLHDKLIQEDVLAMEALITMIESGELSLNPDKSSVVSISKITVELSNQKTVTLDSENLSSYLKTSLMEAVDESDN